ncbi:MAG: NAD(P)H-dependent oxidoreductase [Bacteroidota bacterium]
MMNPILQSRNWRYATKKFDPTKKVSEEDLAVLLEATRLSASSYGLQPYHIYVITDQELKKALRKASWDQSQIEDASHIIVFANYSDFDGALVDDYLELTSATRAIPLPKLQGYGDFMKSTLLGLPTASKNDWTIKQAYLALGNLMQAAAELQIDTCPMEGFEAEKYNDLLGLTDKNQNTAVVLPIGYRSEEDQTQHLAKVRRTNEALFTHI